MDTTKKEDLLGVYDALLSSYGLQGWWPLKSRAGEDGFDLRGYHRGDYRHTISPEEKFEVAVGAILAQSTSWMNVEKALKNLNDAGLLSLHGIKKTPPHKLSPLIKSSLYHNIKAKKLKAFTDFVYENFDGDVESLLALPLTELRTTLLSVWGIGPETADSVILYAAGKPSFVVDAYTKRIFGRLGVVSGNEPYEQVKEFFEKNLPRKAPLYNEFHALIVEHAKQHCKKKEDCVKCPTKEYCEFSCARQ